MKSLIKKIAPKFVLKWYYLMWPFLGMVFYISPSRKLKVIGITGTNGKTTTTHLAAHILEKAGHDVASISTLRFKIKGREWDNKLKMTMPGRMKIHKFMRDAVNAGCTHLVMEVTSEGVKQYRDKFIKFDTAVFTNLTKEHIESHGGFDNYKKAKGKFFIKSHRVSIINLDDENAEYFFNFPADEKIGYTARNTLLADQELAQVVNAENLKPKASGVDFVISGIDFDLAMLGAFNAYNALAAICVGLSQGVSLEQAQQAIKEFKGVPGRMEIVVRKPFSVVVDYAHTPDALEKVYKTLLETRDNKQEARMVCVLGSAGGGRDKWKRPEMGRIAAEYCDEIILTDEDPYDEDPEQILREIGKGFKEEVTYQNIIDRSQAIKKALQDAKENDVIAITGKGAEQLMVTRNGPIEWDDREVVRKEYKKFN